MTPAVPVGTPDGMKGLEVDCIVEEAVAALLHTLSPNAMIPLSIASSAEDLCPSKGSKEPTFGSPVPDVGLSFSAGGNG